MVDRSVPFSHKFGLSVLVVAVFLIFLLPLSSVSQDLPEKLRGYKVFQHPIAISSVAHPVSADAEGRPAFQLESVDLADVSLTGFSFDLRIAVRCPDQSARVEFLTFHDFRVNGMPVEIGDYSHAFVIKKGELKALPLSIRAFVKSQRMLEAAWTELARPAGDWVITGRVFVFGSFRKYGFWFKRAIPVDIALTVKDPLASH